MNFKLLSESDYSSKFISKRLNNGDWDYWLVYEVTNEATEHPAYGEKGCTSNYYNISLFAVSPEAAGEEKLQEAIRSMGYDLELPSDGTPNYLIEWLQTDVGKVEVLCDYGIKAQLWTGNGNNLSKLIKEVHHQARGITMMFDSFMDSPQNGLGSDGWDFISGNVMAGLERYREAKAKGEEITYSPTLEIVSKMHDACRR